HLPLHDALPICTRAPGSPPLPRIWARCGSDSPAWTCGWWAVGRMFKKKKREQARERKTVYVSALSVDDGGGTARDGGTSTTSKFLRNWSTLSMGLRSMVRNSC